MDKNNIKMNLSNYKLAKAGELGTIYTRYNILQNNMVLDVRPTTLNIFLVAADRNLTGDYKINMNS